MIPEAVMRELRYIEISTSKKIRNMRVGVYTSPMRGSGFDFDDMRLYRPGDDIRRIDWNVTARMNAPYIRETHAERELNVVLVVDVSPSMRYGAGSRSKKAAMMYVTGSLLFSAISDQINTGFLAFTDRVLTFSQPRRAKGRAWTLLEELWAIEPKRARTAIVPAIAHLNQHLKKMSIVFIISDFNAEDRVLESRELKMLASRHDVIAVVVEDPAELSLPSRGGLLTLRDMETGGRIRLGLGARNRRMFEAECRERREKLVKQFYDVPIDHVFVSTEGNVVEPLMDVFMRRSMGTTK
jgi:uncharacterized protein (DUF58 family)